jgi:soluble lytic murein transglycosylase-like protein
MDAELRESRAARPPLKLVLCALAPLTLSLAGCATSPASQVSDEVTSSISQPKNAFSERVSYYARAYDVPESLIDRSIRRESGYNPNAHAGPYWGLMQIRLDTARGMGYRGPARGLLDPDTNLKYAVAYLSNAYTVAGRDPDRALVLYASGYFYEARRKRLFDQLKTAQNEPAAAQ